MAEYRGVALPDDIGANIAYKAIWEKGVDQALDAVLGSVERECKELESGGSYFFPDDWTVGLEEGKERAAEYIRDVLYPYKRENQ